MIIRSHFNFCEQALDSTCAGAQPEELPHSLALPPRPGGRGQGQEQPHHLGVQPPGLGEETLQMDAMDKIKILEEVKVLEEIKEQSNAKIET